MISSPIKFVENLIGMKLGSRDHFYYSKEHDGLFFHLGIIIDRYNTLSLQMFVCFKVHQNHQVHLNLIMMNIHRVVVSLFLLNENDQVFELHRKVFHYVIHR